MRNTKRYIRLTVLMILMIAITASCRKFVDIDTPDTKTSTQNAYKDNTTAAATFIGIYDQLSYGFTDGDLAATSVYMDLYADNLKLYDINALQTYTEFYQNNLEPKYAASGNNSYWRNSYALLYSINDAIERLSDNTDVSQSVSQQLLGEAYFLRAFSYFYLVNFYGDVPLVLTTSPDANSRITRSSVSEVYNQMIADLALAEGLLTNKYAGGDVISSSSDRIRPNLAAVNALQARIYLFTKKYAEAEAAATKLINQSSQYSLTEFKDVFLRNSKETIWALPSITLGYNTKQGAVFLLPSDGPSSYQYPVFASKSLLDSFEPGDGRRDNWLGFVTLSGVDYPYPTKYKVPYVDGSSSLIEYDIVLRMAEQYLIRAEARSELGNKSGAIEDLNTLRSKRRGARTDKIPDPLPEISSLLTSDELKAAILHERRVELFTEWGHRFFDLKRSPTIDAVMTAEESVKGGAWSNYKSFLPIPSSDILLNNRLTQNKGYTN